MKTKITISFVNLIALFSFGTSLEGNPIACVQAALRHEYEPIQKEAITLCSKAESLAPIQCVERALQSNIPAIQLSALQLCVGAISLAPVDCAEKAFESQSYLLITGFLKLCSGLRKEIALSDWDQEFIDEEYPN